MIRKEDNTSFNDDELKGYNIFKAKCSSCHQEPLFTNHQFENNGLLPDTSLNDIGRMKITSNVEDSLKFKVPTLRNCEVTYPYMHDGRFNNLQMVLFHYSNDIHTTPTLSPLLKNKIQLSEPDKNCLIAFLKTLTDEDFLRDTTYR
ncbi:MAG: c-type cytochrome [Bacteroidetes bacterium]|nr:c-type cytochrome [Bacteroidota bacterium]